jgi:hypothetical protein
MIVICRAAAVTISARVSARREVQQADVGPLYHPPRDPERFYGGDAMRPILFRAGSMPSGRLLVARWHWCVRRSVRCWRAGQDQYGYRGT